MIILILWRNKNLSKSKKGNPDFKACERYLKPGVGEMRFAQIYSGMILSDAYKKLSPTAKNLLIICAVHLSTSMNYKTLYQFGNDPDNEKEYFSGDGYFILTRSQLKQYGINTGNASGWFRELENAGFIECIERNQHRQRANVYRLSKKWDNS